MSRQRVFLFTCAAAILVVSTAVTPASAQVALNPTPVTQPGPPDLATSVTSNKSSILGGPFLGGGRYDTALVTIRVDNRVTVVASSPLAFITQGSEARGVTLAISIGSLGSRLRQAGNFTTSGGFQCGVSLDHRFMLCSGATIPAGGSAEVVIEVYAEAGPECRAPDSVVAVGDPYNVIAETNELNNQATAIIVVDGLC